MPKTVGQLVINVSAGTSELIVGFQKGKIEARRFVSDTTNELQKLEHSTVSSMQASSASIRALENPLGNNLRALERFSTTIPGVATLFSAAFPVVGALAAGNVIFELGNKFTKFYKDIQQGPAKVASAFRDLNAPIQATNDQLRLSNDLIEKDIAALQGRRQNGLKVALDEARVSADELADSLERDMKGLKKLLEEHEVGFFKSRLGVARTDDIRKDLFGDDGVSGFYGKRNEILDAGYEKIAASKPKDLTAARRDLDGQLKAFDARKIDEYKKHLEEAKDLQQKFLNPPKVDLDKEAKERAANSSGFSSPGTLRRTEFGPSNQTDRILDLEGVIRNLRRQDTGIELREAGSERSDEKRRLSDAAANSKLGRPFQDRVEKLKAEITSLQAQFGAIGQDGEAEAMAKAFGEAAEHLTEINKQLKAQKQGAATPAQSDLYLGLTETKFRTAASLEFAKTAQAENDTIQRRIEGQEALTRAIGQGYEATKRASVEVQLAQKLGKDYNPTFIRDNQAAVDKIRGGLGRDEDAKHADQVKNSINQLEQQTILEKQLGAVQAAGYDYVRATNLAFQVGTLIRAKASGEAAALIKQEAAARANLNAQALAELDLEIEAAKKLAVAEGQGAEATRQRVNENKYRAMGFKGASAEVVQKARDKDDIENSAKVTAEALSAGRAYRNQLELLSLQLGVVTNLEKTEGATRDLEIDRMRIQDQIRETLVKQSLSVGTLKDGLRAFFTEAGEQAKKPGQILYEGLRSAMDGLSTSLAKALTGQKGEFGKLFKDIAFQGLESSIKSTLQRGVAGLGKKLGLDLGDKPDFTVGKPGHVIVDNFPGTIGVPQANAGSNAVSLGTSALFGSVGGFFGKLAGNLLGGLFGGDTTGVSSSSISFPGYAMGGSAPTGMPYWVGENGPELRVDSTPGTIIPRGAMGGDTHNYYVDARNSKDPALTTLNVKQGIQAAHDSAIRTSQLALADRQGRVPR